MGKTSKSVKGSAETKENKKAESGQLTLKSLKEGQSALVTVVGGKGALRQHFLDMGIVPGVEITLEKFAPMGDPMELRIRGYQLTLRLDDAKQILISEPYEKKAEEKQNAKRDNSLIRDMEHLGLGEGGKYHKKDDGERLPKGTVLTFALAGNQNCGKTTLFNQLTGSSQHVGNFPGVTVDQKSGKIKGKENTLVTDLPGIYSLSPYTNEEIVSRKFILEEKPKGIINIVDATNIERNLYLTMQLMELGIPMVLAVNMMDELKGNGGSIDINAMEALLGIPVVPISALKNEGVDELVSHAVHVAEYQEPPCVQDYCDPDEHGGAVHRALHGIMHLIEDHAKEAQIPVRFAASKIIEGDKSVLDALRLDQNEVELVEHVIVQMEEERGLDRAATIADMRFSFIQKLCDACVIKPKESKEYILSRKIDKVLTGKYTAIPMFILIMAAVFLLTFNVIGYWLQYLLEWGITALSDALDVAFVDWGVNSVLHSLIIDGIIGGVGTVITFVPIIITLFFFLSILEDSGYMARVAFVMDKILRKIGLSGKSIVPMLIGFGCTVPGVMATRTLSSERDRKMTVMLTPYMSCSAKLPVYSFIASVFFPKIAWLVMVGLYFIGILVSVVIALIAKKTAFKGEAIPFVMELPNYRLPAIKNVLHLLWDKTKDYIKRAFTVILIATICIWFLQTFDFRMRLVEDPSTSMLATIAGYLSYLFYPLGFGDYRITTALITGFLAKESFVSTASVLFGSGAAMTAVITDAAAFSLLVFCLLYTPCIAAIASIRKELGFKWALATMGGQCLIAWLVSGVISLISFAAGALFI